jgi:hypothetical protein
MEHEPTVTVQGSWQFEFSCIRSIAGIAALVNRGPKAQNLTIWGEKWGGESYGGGRLTAKMCGIGGGGSKQHMKAADGVVSHPNP